jgi:Nucleotidyl transferase AbiEii toxin, Type IV TA system
MLVMFNPKTDILPAAQRELWPSLRPAQGLSYVLYGGTAVALYVGHRVSVDFDFFRAEPLNKAELLTSFPFLRDARTIQEDTNTWVVSVTMPSGSVKVSFFGSITIGRVNQPALTADSTLLVASREDLRAPSSRQFSTEPRRKITAIFPPCSAPEFRWSADWEPSLPCSRGTPRFL